MHATIRRYSPKAGTVTRKDIDELKQRIENGFVPLVQEIRGFHCYYAVNVGDKELVTIGLFEDRTGSAESTRRAAEFVKKDAMKDRLARRRSSRGSVGVKGGGGRGPLRRRMTFLSRRIPPPRSGRGPCFRARTRAARASRSCRPDVPCHRPGLKVHEQQLVQ
jgi:hypothetical protein